MLVAKDVTTSLVVSAPPDSTIREVADLLVSHRISAVPAIDGDALLGIVNQEDLVRPRMVTRRMLSTFDMDAGHLSSIGM